MNCFRYFFFFLVLFLIVVYAPLRIAQEHEYKADDKDNTGDRLYYFTSSHVSNAGAAEQ